MDNTLQELAKTVDLPQMQTKKVIGFLKHDILLSLYRKKEDDYRVPEIKEELEKIKGGAEYRFYQEAKKVDEEAAYVKYKDLLSQIKIKEEQIAGGTEKQLWDKEVNKRVADTYKKWYNTEFNPVIHLKHKSPCLFLMGPPGHGKTTSYMVAAKEVCAEMDFNFVPHISGEYIPRKEDFIMVVQECAGENSAITFGGVPKAETIMKNGKEVSVLKRALNYRFTVFDDVAGGVLLFDDAANAAQVIQNVLLPVTQNHTFQELVIKNACVGLTGNLGALDGTYTSELSSALKTRVVGIFTTDSLQDFKERAYQIYNDSLGAAMIDVYLDRNPNDFAKLPDGNKKAGHATPRTWEALIQLVRSSIERHGGRGRGEERAMEEIMVYAYSQVGPEIGHKLKAFYHSYVTGADPIARRAINEEKFDPNEINAKYKGGAGQDELTFGFQYATACGDYAINRISESMNDKNKTEDQKKEIFEETIRRFGSAVLKLNESEYSYSLDHLKNKMASQIVSFSEPNRENKRELNHSVREAIAMQIAQLPDGATTSRRKILVEVITDFHTLATSSNVVGRKNRTSMKNS